MTCAVKENRLSFMEGRTNCHHNIPGSRGGSDCGQNVSQLLESRHSRFHRNFAQNYTVDEITRRVVYDSLGLDGEHVMSELVADKILQVVTLSNWSRLYRPAATLSIADPSALAKVDGLRELTRKYLEEEREWIRTRFEKIFARDPTPASPFLKAFLEFFDRHSPIAALRELYMETYDGGVSWVKAMRRDTRKAVLQYVCYAEAANISHGSRSGILAVLQTQKKHVCKNLKKWS